MANIEKRMYLIMDVSNSFARRLENKSAQDIAPLIKDCVKYLSVKNYGQCRRNYGISGS